ncbi:MAG: MarR family transcriptional regulator [Chloroflexi bacterium]|nr:MarR family transcriptional regulator [Chloroflexota bacterium]
MSKHLQDYVGFRIIQFIKAHRKLAEAAFSEVGLYPGQEMILFELWEEEGLTQSQLAENVCVEPPTVTKTLQRLERAGIVERRQDVEDARVSRVYLTPEGAALRDQVQQMWDDLEAMTIKGLTDAEKALLLRLIEQITKNLAE